MIRGFQWDLARQVERLGWLRAQLPRYADCARAMGLAAEGEGDQAAVARLVEALRDVNRDLAVPTPKSYGIDEARWTELLPLMAEQALASGSPGNNPRIPDIATIEASVAKTGRCIIIHEATRTGGFGAELAALVQERCFYSLEAPVERVTGFDTPYPHSMEWVYFPGPIRLGTAPAAIILAEPDPILVVGAMVAGELYGRKCPVVVLAAPDFAAVAAAGSARVTAAGGAARVTTSERARAP